MKAFKRVTPANLPGKGISLEERNGFTVVLKYENEKEDCPWIADLSHRMKLDYQLWGSDQHSGLDMNLPTVPGQAVFNGEWLISALGKTQFSFLHVSGKTARKPDKKGFTDISDGRCLFALGGKGAEGLMEKFTRMNINNPGLELPFILQGPMLHTFGQLHVIGSRDDRVFLINLGRGYARSVVHAIMDAGTPYGLFSAGENRFISQITL